MTSRPGPRSWRRIAVLLLGLVASLSLATGAWAQETDDDGPAVSLRLSPAEVTIPHQPGTTDHTIRVDNLGSRPVSVVAMVEEFTVTADGTTHFIGPEEIASSGWVRLDTDGFDLAPGERRDVQLTVDVPEDAEPGERYLGVVFAVPAADGEGNIRVTHRVATKLYVELPGPRIERLELGELTGPTLIDSRPARFELTVHNEGNVHRRFEEDDQLVATSGDASFPFQNFTILAGSTRIVEAVWADPPLVCWCTVEVTVDDGQGQLLTATTRVVAFPVRLAVALLVATLGVALLLVARRRRRSRPTLPGPTDRRGHTNGGLAPIGRRLEEPPTARQPDRPRVEAEPPRQPDSQANVLDRDPITPRRRRRRQTEDAPQLTTKDGELLGTGLFTAHGTTRDNQSRRRRRHR